MIQYLPILLSLIPITPTPLERLAVREAQVAYMLAQKQVEQAARQAGLVEKEAALNEAAAAMLKAHGCIQETCEIAADLTIRLKGPVK